MEKPNRNAYFREYRAKNIAKNRAYQLEYQRKWRKENGREAQKRWAEKNKEKLSVHRRARYALKTGKIKRGPCEKCKTRKNVVMHHDDYEKPLEIRWLCKIHHREIHYG